MTEAEKVLAHLFNIEKTSANLRELMREFCIKKMHVTLGYEDNLKGQRACLKKHLREGTYSTICRILQAVFVEVTLDIRGMKWSLMTLLEFYKYPESCWKTIFASVSNKAPTLKELQAKCDILLADNRIELKNKKEKDGSESNYEKIKACLPKVSDERLADLLQLVESIVNEKTSPDTKL